MVTGASVQTKQHRLPALEVGDQNTLDLGSQNMAAADVLSSFVRSSQPWSRIQVPLPLRLRCALWALIPVELLWGLWLWTIITGATACGGSICTVATLNHHAAALFALAAISVAGLAPFTGGLSRCGGREAVGAGGAAAAGAVALLGIATLLIGALIMLIILAALIVGFAGTA